MGTLLFIWTIFYRGYIVTYNYLVFIIQFRLMHDVISILHCRFKSKQIQWIIVNQLSPILPNMSSFFFCFFHLSGLMDINATGSIWIVSLQKFLRFLHSKTKQDQPADPVKERWNKTVGRSTKIKMNLQDFTQTDEKN